jgi:hypothetical protein
MGNQDIAGNCNCCPDCKNKKFPGFEYIFRNQKFNHKINSQYIKGDVK